MERYLITMKHSKIIYSGLKTLDKELKKEEWTGAKYVIIVDENTFDNCLTTLISNVEALQEATLIEVPSGEECKCVEVASQVWQTLLDGKNDRKSVLVNLGGGALCDLGGFVASTYKRGIRHIHIPTTLLAMVDAAIGGKTAIDEGGVKNSVGTFYESAITVIDSIFLHTLPQEELLNGKMEMVKTAAVADPSLYHTLISSPDIETRTIKEVAKIKQRIVKADPYDHSIRKILNFGHTFGHAIEIHSHIPHGVAVGLGMIPAMYLSVKKLGLEKDIYDTYTQWIKEQVSIPHYTMKDVEHLLSILQQDKKNQDRTVTCVLLKELGVAAIDIKISDLEVFDSILNTMK